MQEKVKHTEYLYDELDLKEKEIDNLKESIKQAKNLYKKQTAFAQEMHVEKCQLALQLEEKEKDIADLENAKCEKGCNRYNKSVDEIAEAASKHREKLVALKEIADEQKEKIFCLRGHRNELFDEIDKLKAQHAKESNESNDKVSILQEENDILHGKLNDQKEELVTLKFQNQELEVKTKKRSSIKKKLSLKNLLQMSLKIYKMKRKRSWKRKRSAFISILKNFHRRESKLWKS